MSLPVFPLWCSFLPLWTWSVLLDSAQTEEEQRCWWARCWTPCPGWPLVSGQCSELPWIIKAQSGMLLHEQWAWAWAWEDILSDFSGMKNVVCYSFCGFVCFWIVWFVVGGEFPGIETSFSVGKLLPWQRSRAACAGKYIASANLFLNTELFQSSQISFFKYVLR